MDKEYLESLVEQGLSTRDIAKKENKSKPSVRYWLKKFGLKTKHRSFKDIPLEEKIDKNNQYCDICNIKLSNNNAYILNEKIDIVIIIIVKNVFLKNFWKKELILSKNVFNIVEGL